MVENVLRNFQKQFRARCVQKKKKKYTDEDRREVREVFSKYKKMFEAKNYCKNASKLAFKKTAILFPKYHRKLIKYWLDKPSEVDGRSLNIGKPS